ncbi:MAG: DUF948 domain-containing protein [Candidatus Methylomirabilales bacterium]
MSEPVVIGIAISIALVAVALAATLFSLIPLIRQARETFSRVNTLIQKTEGDLQRTVSELQQTVHNVNEVSAGVQNNMDKVSQTAEALEGFGKTIRKTSDIIQTTLHPSLLSFGALVVGLKTGSWYLLRKFFLKKKKRR